MKKIIFIILAIIFLGSPLIIHAQTQNAQNAMINQNLIISNCDTNIEVIKNGELSVTEDINFASPPSQPWYWPIFATNISDLKILNGSQKLTKKDWETDKSSDTTILTIKANSSNESTWQITYKVKNKISYYSNYDELHWIVAFENGAIINKASVKVVLPVALSDVYQQKIYSYTVGDAVYKKIDSQTLYYEARSIGPEGNFTITAHWPKEIVQPSLLARIFSKVSSLDFLAGLLLSLIIVFIFWLILKLLSLRQKRTISPISNAIMTSPPNDIPAVLAGVLVNKRLGIRGFAATILELARQGFLTIVKEKNKLYLIKRKPFDEIKPSEKAIIDEMFGETDHKPKISINLADLKSAEKEKLSSRQISVSSEHIYKIISILEYFRANPHEVYLKYLKASIILFFITLVGFFISIPFIYTYPIIIFIPIGLILASFVIPERASSLALYTKRGKEVTRQWLTFKNYLIFGNNQKKEDLEEFFRYLPYAIVLGVEKKWAHQFSKTPFQVPSWLELGYSSYDINDFMNKFLPLVYDLAYTLIETRSPTAK